MVRLVQSALKVEESEGEFGTLLLRGVRFEQLLA